MPKYSRSSPPVLKICNKFSGEHPCRSAISLKCCFWVILLITFTIIINPLSANPTKWSNTLKQFVGNLPTNCLSLFDHFVKLALKGLKKTAKRKKKMRKNAYMESRWGSNKMHQGKNYQDFLKWRRLLLGHSLIIIKWTWGVFFPKIFQFVSWPPTIRSKRVIYYCRLITIPVIVAIIENLTMKVNFMESITPKQVIIKFLGDLQERKKTPTR